ncbi:hypothetical protein WH52_12605 [Tenacibaculum holothuriorum]|uniref:Uncharacterized protein n=1 Tax=Tenacibaculum holothuriorum TaxID=1635173 RepID=A0A1Y2PA39_9FLAO|nr:hypothetical protein WH52_12605 [Tenacibaculum holothuriorum]
MVRRKGLRHKFKVFSIFRKKTPENQKVLQKKNIFLKKKAPPPKFMKRKIIIELSLLKSISKLRFIEESIIFLRKK